jgi:hypothetical protein
MTGVQVEYVGFTQGEAAREYTLRVKLQGEAYRFTLAIANDAFTRRRARYQDAPDICFLKLQRELAACQSQLPAAYLNVTDAELEEYRVAHTPKPPQRRPKPLLPQP